MKIKAVIILLFFAGAHLEASKAFVSDPCDDPAKIQSDLDLELVSSKLISSGLFVGAFEIKNNSSNKSTFINFVSEKSQLFVFRPDTSIEYLDISGGWRRLISLPGSFRGGMMPLRISPGKSYKFQANLMSQETATLNARDFRMLVRTENPEGCVISDEFQSTPPRLPVVDLKSRR